MKIKFLFLIAFLGFHLNVNSEILNNPEITWHGWTDKTLTQAKAINRLVLISLTAEWCQFCKKMDAVTYRDKAVIDELNKHYLTIKADEAKYPDIVKRYAKIGRPGTIILDHKGNILLAKNGYLKPQWMLWTLQAVKEESNNKNG